jgi:hypothetical protein
MHCKCNLEAWLGALFDTLVTETNWTSMHIFKLSK